MKTQNTALKLKIYLYKNAHHQKPSRFPAFVLEGDPSKIRELFVKLLNNLNTGNQQYVALDTVIFEADRFNFATIEC